jgi:hypothetical protein
MLLDPNKVEKISIEELNQIKIEDMNKTNRLIKSIFYIIVITSTIIIGGIIYLIK